MTRRLAAFCLLLLAFAGSATAQSNDPQYVIKVGASDHYMAHVYNTTTSTWQITDVTAFDPATCLWYSSPNIEHNYYFLDQSGNYRYLGAPLTIDGTLFLSTTHPGTVVLNKKDGDYYFYDWDRGVARGVQLEMSECEAHPEYNGINSGKCWKVVWLSYESNSWKMSHEYGYDPTDNAVPYRHVTVIPHEEEISNESGGITDLVIPDCILEYGQSAHPNGTSTEPIFIPTAYSYDLKPAYTQYDFAAVHNAFFNLSAETHYNTSNDQVPSATPSGEQDIDGYLWEIEGDGASYLDLTGATTATPTLTCTGQNTENSHKLATLTLTVTYENGSTQTRSATVTVKTLCQNPQQASAPVVTYEDVTVSWFATAENYKVYWKKSDPTVTTWNSDEVDNVSSYAITGLDYGTEYDYKVSAYCSGAYQEVPDNLIYHFTTKQQPNALIYGAVFGGGRMANVGGKTEVVIINCDGIDAVYGGNDIAGSVLGGAQGTEGSTVTLGVKAGDPYANVGTTKSSIGVNVGSVYGGGNGYYAYNGTSFVAADDENTTFVVPDGGTVRAMTPSHTVGDSVWGNNSGADVTLVVPKIFKTAITVAESNYVKIDSLFGGAKNAFLTANTGNGSTIIVKGGTIFAVFGGNNFGGTQGYGKHHIEVQGTKTNTSATTGYGRDFGIGYVFGGGNKVYGSTTEIFITGGQCDTVFAGGNSADVYAANVTVNSPVASSEGNIYGFYSNSIDEFYKAENTFYNQDSIVPKSDYGWDGTGVYNVRTLFGGNNQAQMDGLPIINLTSGTVGTVYGGGNAGDMMAQTTGGAISFNNSDLYDYSFDYSTKVMMTSPTIMVDYLYGGCQMSNVGYSTWVQIQNGHVGTVYGGCNISGDVGSTRIHLDADPNNPDGLYQEVYGATYVEASGGIVHKNLFAGSNGFYHCLDSYGVTYVAGLTYDPAGRSYVGMKVPTHNETHAIISGTAVINGNVYAGGNMAPVGFTTAYVSHVSDVAYPYLVGLSSVRMIGGEVKGNVYGGGNMASINGSNEVRVTAGSIGTGPNGGALYGGNDRLGKAGSNGMSNRKLPESYNTASDNYTSLIDPSAKVNTYIGVTGCPYINTVYGGGNGAYNYDGTSQGGDMDYCDATDLPIQDNIFVDIAIDGSNGANGAGHIDYVYGGGNGVYATGFVKVFINVRNMGNADSDHIGTIYGGNNMGNLDIVPDIILLNGNVNTIYGGCNSGAMIGSKTVTGGDGTNYNNVGSYVRLRDTYPTASGTVVPNVSVSGAIYGGCRMNRVDHNTLVLVEEGNHTATLFGGCDISGNVADTTQVIVTGGTVGAVFGGGNGNYDYTSGPYAGLDSPYCDSTRVELRGGTCVGNAFGGGYAGTCGDTYMLVDGCTIGDGIYGGGNEAGVTINAGSFATGSSTIEMTGGSVATGIYGGCNLTGDIEGEVDINITGGTIGTANNNAYIHGGGYGQDTEVAKNITITFGDADVEGSAYPKLYGELYGGSALGNTNTATDADHPYTTHINIYNGTIVGDVFGGGLGDKPNDIKAMVFGKIYLQIGKEYSGGVFRGEATLSACRVFGCNNQNGSPQDDVFVDVYKTAHIDGVNTVDDDDFAIDNVFGGGNESHYAPEDGNEFSEKKTRVYIHGCQNTINFVYGGGNAANSVGVITIIEGGHFNEVYGGGNGWNVPAHIGKGGIGMAFLAGHVNYYFVGSNKQGDNEGGIFAPTLPSNYNDCGDLIVDSYYVGTNQAEIYHDLITTITCEQGTDFNFKYVYGGSRWATVYGDIKLTVQGGKIEKLFGGSKGDYHPNAPEENKPAHVRRFPSQEEIAAMDLIDPTYYSTGLREYVQEHPEVIGHGGNIVLTITGGSIIDVYGGCDKLGNVDGKITVLVNENNDACALHIGNIYGAGNDTDYEPSIENIKSPQVTVLKGTVGAFDFNNNGSIDNNEKYDGNVYGAAHHGTTDCDPVVIVGESSNTQPVTIKGSVFGGGDEGDLDGGSEVIVVPVHNKITIISPNPSTGHALVVTDVNGQAVHSGDDIDEYADLNLVALPNIYGYKFNQWVVTNGSLEYSHEANTIFTMGQADARIEAEFGEASITNLLSVVQPDHGNITVTDGQGASVDFTRPISEGAVLNIVTTVTDPGYVFSKWVYTGTGVRVSNSLLPTATFTMGTSDATLTASIVPAHQLTFETTNGEITATDALGNAVTSGASIGEGAEINIMAAPNPGYRFAGWTVVSDHGNGGTVENPAESSTKFTMGTENAILRATFESTGRGNNTRNLRR